jgi:hypothetical protein
MFGSPCLMYHCWKDAKREVKNNPNDNSGGGCLAVMAVIFIICLLQACFQNGGFGIMLGICVVLGLWSGIVNNK